MFSSNQELKISGSFDIGEELRLALKFGIEFSGWHEPFTRKEKQAVCTYQIGEDGSFCIGWDAETDGWNPFQFGYNLTIIEEAIREHFKENFKGYDGFLMEECHGATEGVKNGFYGILKFSPFKNYYEK